MHARRSTTVRPGAPRKLGHVNCLSSHFDDATRFYTEALGMTVADRLGERRDLVQRQHRPPRDGAGRQGARPFPPPRLRHRRHRPDARPARPPRAARALARLGPDPARRRRQHRELRPDRRGGVLRRALLRHGAAPGRSRAARLARRPLLVEHVGAAAAPLLLPLRPRCGRVGARQPRDARRGAPGVLLDDAGHGIHDPALARAGAPRSCPYPPWHYVGDFLVVEYWADPEKAASCLPAGLEPHPDPGRCAAVFADWQSCSEQRRRAARPVALAVQGGLPRRQRAARRRRGDDVPVHLGRSRLRAHARLAAGLPEEARLDLDHAHVRARQPRRPGHRAGRDVRRHVRGLRAAGRRGDRDARARLGVGADAQRPADRQRPPLPSARGGPPRRPGRPRARALAQPRPGRSRRSGRAARRSSSSAPATRSTTCSPRSRIGKGFRFTFGYTVDDQEIVKDLRT